ncbi:NACHT and WD repeat domain-containing protein [Allokutzneria albata]|uniref:WD40 repeat n=1 Tax=Allokutzneria albata TaxID=211114 RepID=A0A1G9VPY7_ALLAB|nr:NACHT and WD repeat domain-containing protein [Allokutzneria albata]SDM74021.1 WD40 repeat [Allokutzneria albata]
MSAERRALCLGVGAFSEDGDDEPDLDAWQPLPFAADRVQAVRTALAEHGYRCVQVDANGLTAAELGGRVQAAIRSAGSRDVLVVHVLSHGHLASSGVYAIGADGAHDPASSVETWLSAVEDFPDRPFTLFLLDLCHSGSATRLPRHPEVTSPDERRAWVIAAAGASEPAYDGRFSTAVTNVLAAIRSGGLDIHASLEHVPLGTVITSIRREVDRLTGDGYGQRVTATPFDGEYPELPFFPNPAFHDDPLRRAISRLDTAVVPFVDVRLDAAHFQDRASGRGPLRDRIRVGCFTGRAEELSQLSQWLSGDSGLCVVTGSPGTGKSALLGILVCAAHPQLRESTAGLWRHVEGRPPRTENLIAVHARQCSVGELTASLARQLGIAETSDPQKLLDAIGDARPVIVVDALDEAIAPEAVLRDVLMVLRPACRLLLAMRPWDEFSVPRSSADVLIDLDAVPPKRVRTELTQYVAELLEFSNIPYPSIRTLFSESVGAALAEEDGPWGGFLLAGMITHHALKTAMPATPAGADAWLKATLPLTLPDLFAAEIAPERVGPWGRPVLIAVAHAHGAGMPSDVIRRLATVFAGSEPTAHDVRDALRRARFYLRTKPDSDGTTLYRLFHQSLVDHLRTGDHSALLDHLVESRRWHQATPYVLRHALQHAADAGRADELLEDPEFLVHADPHWIDLDHARSGRARRLAMVYRNSQDQHFDADSVSRRQILAVDAARFQDSELSREFATTWKPLWATGNHTNPAIRAVLAVEPECQIYEIDCAIVDGLPLAVAVCSDQSVRAWNLATTEQIGIEGLAAGRPHVRCTTLHGRPVAVISSGHDTLEVRELPSLRRLRHHHVDSSSQGPTDVLGLSCVVRDGRTIGALATKNAVRTWDLDTGAPFGPLIESEHALLAATIGMRDERLIVITVDSGEGITVWDATTAEPTPAPSAMSGPARRLSSTSAVAIADVGGRSVIMAGSPDGNVRMHSLETGELVGELVDAHVYPVDQIHCMTYEGRVLAVVVRHFDTLQVWDVVERTPVGRRTLSDSSLETYRVSSTTIADRPTIVVGRGRWIQLWDVATHLVAPEQEGHVFGILRIACVEAPSGMLALTSDGTTLRVRALASGESVRRPIDVDLFRADFVATALDGHPVAMTLAEETSLSPRPRLTRWDLTRDSAGHPLPEKPGGPHLLASSGERPMALTRVGGRPLMITAETEVGGNAGDVLRVWDLAAERRVASLRHFSANQLEACACFSIGDLPVVATVDKSGFVRIWDIHNLTPVGEGFSSGAPTGIWPRIMGIDLAGRPAVVVVSPLRRERIELRDALIGEVLATPLPDLSATVLACCGQVLVASTVDGRAERPVTSLWLWDLVDECVLDEIPLPGLVQAAQLLPDGRLLVGVNSDLVVLQRKEKW